LALYSSRTVWEYVRRAQSAGLQVDDFAPRLSFFFAAYTDLFEEIAKFRAALTAVAFLMKEKFKRLGRRGAAYAFTPRPRATLTAAAAQTTSGRNSSDGPRAGRTQSAAHQRL